MDSIVGVESVVKSVVGNMPATLSEEEKLVNMQRNTARGIQTEEKSLGDAIRRVIEIRFVLTKLFARLSSEAHMGERKLLVSSYERLLIGKGISVSTVMRRLS